MRTPEERYCPNRVIREPWTFLTQKNALFITFLSFHHRWVYGRKQAAHPRNYRFKQLNDLKENKKIIVKAISFYKKICITKNEEINPLSILGSEEFISIL
ncbi:hypothetical protein [Klebsiella michiganensis]|uniref:hypothetical protein n=1 Tax=Klebsiella michiganensis TaxID=1134687 RepID=UPI001CF672B9|nr:hypothetical protein [Klebsiella michiganensis]MCB3571023.1 hypothetical protein [Klebsiella michiganensis]